MKAKYEDSRPKAQPADTTAIPAPTPDEPPKRRKPVKGHDDTAPFVASLGGGRIMMLEGVSIAIVLQDPFYDYGRYPIYLTFEEFWECWSGTPPIERVVSEYARLGITEPPLASRIEPDAMFHRLASQLLAVRAAIDTELKRLEVTT